MSAIFYNFFEGPIEGGIFPPFVFFIACLAASLNDDGQWWAPNAIIFKKNQNLNMETSKKISKEGR
jgi:hypothetical protein